MPRIYLPKTNIVDNTISITDEKARYLISVLRCKKGDELTVFDGEGKCFKTTIIKSEKKEITAEVTEKFLCDIESPIDIILVQGLLKGEKMDLVIQKATELGVKEIVPVVTGRSQLRETKKITRWRKIAGESSRQSGRSLVPVIHEPVEFEQFLPSCFASSMTHGFIFYEEGGLKLSEAVESLKKIEDPIPSLVKGGGKELIIIIGPEGGFTKEEIAFAEAKGFFVISLGKRILRAETAAITAVALAQFLLGDMG